MNYTSWFYLKLLVEGSSGHICFLKHLVVLTPAFGSSEDALGLLQEVGLWRLLSATSLSQSQCLDRYHPIHVFWLDPQRGSDFLGHCFQVRVTGINGGSAFKSNCVTS